MQKMGLFPVDNHALVFGASGISGWAIVNQILSDYPAKGVFSAVTALTNRPLPAEYALWPKDSRLDVVSRLDLMKGSQEELETSMKEKIKGVENVTQVFYFCKSASNTTTWPLESPGLNLVKSVGKIGGLMADIFLGSLQV